ncbi:MAG: patatin-like phospholipase family protein [Alphaproteobacteria bacterium]
MTKRFGLRPFIVITIVFGALMAWLASSHATIAAAATGAEPQAERPRIGLVLAGGGALGMAHIGVLKSLERLGIQVDMIVGTSMGAIIGGLYASGLSADDIEQAVDTIDWGDVLSDSTPRPERSIRRKADDLDLLLDYRLRIQEGEIIGPEGVLAGQRLTLELRRRLTHVATVRDFDDLPIRFRAVAADIETGDPVVLGKGDLALALRASMSLPGVFAPVEIDGRLLVDGGIARNLPIDVAREMGADLLIVSALPTHLKKADQLQSLLSVVSQTISIFIQQNELEQLRTLTPDDVLIETRLPPEISTSSFEAGHETIPYGENAALAAEAKLAALAWSGARPTPQRQPDAMIVVDRIVIENGGFLSDEALRGMLGVEPGEPFELDQLEQGLAAIYGLGHFRHVDYGFSEQNGERVLTVVAEPQRSNAYFSFGLELSTDFDADSTYQLGLGFTQGGLNELGGEWRLRGSIGNDEQLLTDFYQPLDTETGFFILPRLSLGSTEFSIFDHGQRLAEVEARYLVGEFRGGIEFSNDLMVAAFVRRGIGDVDNQIGFAPGAPVNFEIGSLGLIALYDTFDHLWWPRSGQFVASTYEWATDALGADPEYQALSLIASAAQSLGGPTLLGTIQSGLTFDGEQPIIGFTHLGGFLRLSGFASDQLSNENVMLARLVVFDEAVSIGGGSLFGFPLYFGGSLEYGGVFAELEDVARSHDYFLAGSLFTGLDTPLGSLYLGYGHAEGGNDAVYLFLGRPF